MSRSLIFDIFFELHLLNAKYENPVTSRNNDFYSLIDVQSQQQRAKRNFWNLLLASKKTINDKGRHCYCIAHLYLALLFLLTGITVTCSTNYKSAHTK